MSYVADTAGLDPLMGDDNQFSQQQELFYTTDETFLRSSTDSTASVGYGEGSISMEHSTSKKTEVPYVVLDSESMSAPYSRIFDESSVYGQQDSTGSVYGGSSAERNVYSGTDSLLEEDDEMTDSDSDDEDQPMRFSKRLADTRSWNEEFQKILEEETSAEKYNKLARLAHDFVFAAETYGKIIISELCLPAEKKTIKPIAVGGQAGGEKYIVQGIFFKFALDIFNIYGSDEYAMKAASHDLKGLIHYYSCQIPGLHVPLMALIDYLGFRLIAITILPINASTIRYGSSDAGVTIHCEDDTMNAMMKKAARKMHLRGHYVGTPEGLAKKIYGPVDIEGHLGTDGRYYVVDFARTFPPERPAPHCMGRKGIILYNLLRPELVKSNETPLSSDAFTRWAAADPKKDRYNQDVTKATERLLGGVIPMTAKKLNNLQKKAENSGVNSIDLIEIIHSAGINVRHLGHLRRLSEPKVQQAILIEIVARTVRKQIAAKFREKTREVGVPTEEPHKLAAVQYLNMLLGRHKRSADYWSSLKRSLLFKYANCLLENELVKEYDLRQSLDIVDFFTRLRSLAPNIISLTEGATQDFMRAIEEGKESGKQWGVWVPEFKFLLSDMTALNATVKHMNLIDIAEANAMFYSGLEEKGSDQSRMLIQGLNKFQIASRKMPFLDVDTIILLGDMLVSRATVLKKAPNGHPDANLLLTNASMAYQTALNMQPSNTKCMIGIGNIHASRGQLKAAVDKYNEALAVDPKMAMAHLQLARVAKHQSSFLRATEIEPTVSHLRDALAIDSDYTEAVSLMATTLFLHFYISLKEKGVQVLEEKHKATLSEIGTFMEKSLKLSPYENEIYEFIKPAVLHASAADPKDLVWRDWALALLWEAAQVSPRFKELFCSQLASMEGLHFRFGLDFITEPAFSGIAMASSTIHTFSLDTISTVSEQVLIAWLKQHPTPLRSFTVKNCAQVGEETLKAISSLPHAFSLETLCFDNDGNFTKGAMLECYRRKSTGGESMAKEEASEAETVSSTVDGVDEQKERWGSLVSLTMRQVLEVDDEVATIISQMPILTSLDLNGCTSTTDISLRNLPDRLLKVRLSGTLTAEALKSFASRCSALTHVSLQGVSGLTINQYFGITSILHNLVHFQTHTGSVYLFSGSEAREIRFEDKAQQRFIDRSGSELYRLATMAHCCNMEGSGIKLQITSQTGIKTISEPGMPLVRCYFAQGVGWQTTSMVEGMSTARSLQYMSQTKTLIVQPPQARVLYRPQFGEASIMVAPRTNITLLLPLIYLALSSK